MSSPDSLVKAYQWDGRKRQYFMEIRTELEVNSQERTSILIKEVPRTVPPPSWHI